MGDQNSESTSTRAGIAKVRRRWVLGALSTLTGLGGIARSSPESEAKKRKKKRCKPACSGGFRCVKGKCKCTQGCCWENVGVFGTSGDGPDNFWEPYGIAARGDMVYVADASNDRISVWEKSGDSWSNAGTFGSPGVSAENLLVPNDVSVAPDGTVFIVDRNNDRISVWENAGGTWGNVAIFGSDSDPDPGNLDDPEGVYVAADNTVYVADSGNHRISVWAKNGADWGNVATFGSGPGNGADELYFPIGIAVVGDAAYVVDSNNSRVSIWERDGGNWAHQENLVLVDPGKGRLAGPTRLSVTPDGTIYVVDRTEHRVWVWQKKGGTWKNLANIGTKGTGRTNLLFPRGVSVDDAGLIYVSDTDNNRVSVWEQVCVD